MLLVLVQPLDDKSAPGKHLSQHGEGFFLISYEVEDLSMAIERIQSQGGKMEDQSPRKGISNWQVADLNKQTMFGILTQICQEEDK